MLKPAANTFSSRTHIDAPDCTTRPGRSFLRLPLSQRHSLRPLNPLSFCLVHKILPPWKDFPSREWHSLARLQRLVSIPPHTEFGPVLLFPTVYRQIFCIGSDDLPSIHGNSSLPLFKFTVRVRIEDSFTIHGYHLLHVSNRNFSTGNPPE